MKRKKHIHFIGICGYAVSGLAMMAKDLGFEVTGSDEGAYPPVTAAVTEAGIPWVNRHRRENVCLWGRPDFVVQGNQIRAGNVEAEEARRRKLTIVSEAEFFYQLTKNRRRIVVGGTHGKTTTAALITWILEVGGRSPGFRLGALAKNFSQTVGLGRGKEFVFEGDEYTTSVFDPRPKFYHFHPQAVVLLNVEWDHPDVYRSRQDYIAVFRNLVGSLPLEGKLTANSDDSVVRRLIGEASCLVETFGLESGDWRAANIKTTLSGTTFSLSKGGREWGNFKIGLVGRHNVYNCLAAIAAASAEGVGRRAIRGGLATFRGTNRRFEIKGVAGGVVVIDDYAHHPSKVRATIAAARESCPGGRILAVFVPHTFSRTEALLAEYATAFSEADEVIIGDIESAREKHLAKTIHAQDLVARIKEHNPRVFYIPNRERVVAFLAKRARSGDAILCLSVGGFGGLADKLVARLGRGKPGKV